MIREGHSNILFQVYRYVDWIYLYRLYNFLRNGSQLTFEWHSHFLLQIYHYVDWIILKRLLYLFLLNRSHNSFVHQSPDDHYMITCIYPIYMLNIYQINVAYHPYLFSPFYNYCHLTINMWDKHILHIFGMLAYNY